jgi:hypothetical protein
MIRLRRKSISLDTGMRRYDDITGCRNNRVGISRADIDVLIYS